MQLIYPTSGRATHPRPSGRRPRRQAAHRLPRRESLLLRLPHRRRSARRTSRGCSALPAPTSTRASARVIEEVGIGADRRMRLRAFSKGKLQRVGLAQALDQRSRGRVPRRADVGPRSARPPPRSRSDPEAPRARLHGVLQLPHPVGCRSRCAAASASWRKGGSSPAARSARCSRSSSRAGSWSSRACRTRSLGRLRGARQDASRRCRRAFHARAAAGSGTGALIAELRATGAQLVSLNPVRETLEEYFVQAGRAAASRARTGL